MSLENPQKNQDSEQTPKPEEQESNEERKRRGMALKALIALTNGILGKNKRVLQEKGTLIAVVEKTKETYKSLDELERQIDPSGNLGAEIDDKLASGIGKIADWLEKHGGKAEEKEY